MKNITYDNCKRVYELYKQVEFWANRNEFRNAVLEFEKVAEYLWDIDQDFSQKLYDFYHQMLDAYYYKVHKLDEFKKFEDWNAHLDYIENYLKESLSYLITKYPAPVVEEPTPEVAE